MAPISIFSLPKMKEQAIHRIYPFPPPPFHHQPHPNHNPHLPQLLPAPAARCPLPDFDRVGWGGWWVGIVIRYNELLVLEQQSAGPAVAAAQPDGELAAVAAGARPGVVNRNHDLQLRVPAAAGEKKLSRPRRVPAVPDPVDAHTTTGRGGGAEGAAGGSSGGEGGGAESGEADGDDRGGRGQHRGGGEEAEGAERVAAEGAGGAGGAGEGAGGGN